MAGRMMNKIYEELRISLSVRAMGEDLCVTVCGGDRPHIGSVAIAEPRPSLEREGAWSSTVSTYNFTGHKDDAVAVKAAHLIASALRRRVVVLCGIHYDAPTPALLRETEALAARMAEDVIARFGGED